MLPSVTTTAVETKQATISKEVIASAIQAPFTSREQTIQIAQEVETSAAAAPADNASFVAELVSIFKEVDGISKDPDAIRADNERMASAEKEKETSSRIDPASKSGPSHVAEQDGQHLSSPQGKNKAIEPQQTQDEYESRRARRRIS